MGKITNKDVAYILNHHHSLLILEQRRALAPNSKARIWVNSDLKRHLFLNLDGCQSGPSNKTFGWVLVDPSKR